MILGGSLALVLIVRKRQRAGAQRLKTLDLEQTANLRGIHAYREQRVGLPADRGECEYNEEGRETEEEVYDELIGPYCELESYEASPNERKARFYVCR